MASNSLESLMEYSTPRQTQQPQQTRPDKENEETPGQMRKRPMPAQQKEEAPQQKASLQSTHNPSPHDNPQNPPHVTPTPEGTLPSYTMLQFGRTRSQSPPPSPTSEAQKRRRTQEDTRPTENGDREQNMVVDEEYNHPVDQAIMPKTNTRGSVDKCWIGTT